MGVKPKPVSNRRLTLLRKLNQKKYRQSEQLFLAEGGRAVEQIIRNEQLEVSGLFFDESQHFWEQKPWNLFSETIPSAAIAEKDFTGVSDTDHPQGVLALCQMPQEASAKQLAQQTGIIIAADAIQDPGNMGTIIRTASWFGAQGLLSGKGTVDLFHPKVVRSTAGTTGVIPHTHTMLSETLPIFEKQGWQIVLLNAGTSSMPLKAITKQEKMLVVIGNEASGVDETLFTPARQSVRIDSAERAGVESLNAGVALAIALYVLG